MAGPALVEWRKVQSALVDRLLAAAPERLAIRANQDGWPVWAVAGHVAGARVYWLCGVAGAPGAGTTPFSSLDGIGWEDDLDHPRDAAELRWALESSWLIVEDCVARWTPEQLGESVTRRLGTAVQLHTRNAILTRLVMHDSFHCAEISTLLSVNRAGALDPWEPV